MKSDPMILFLHIPKTGGQTLKSIIQTQCCSDKKYGEEDNNIWDGIYYFPNGFFKESDLSLPDNVRSALGRQDIRAVIGHFYFGIHQYVTRPWTYITLLRNPIERIISLYNHIYHWWQKAGKAKMSIEDFVKNAPYREVDNDQTRRISGLNPDVGCCTKSTLEKAKENLCKQFSVVGLTERFDEALILMKRTLAWKNIDKLLYYPKNVSSSWMSFRRYSTASLPRKTLDAIIERNEFDLELYEFAKDRMEEAIASQDLSFLGEVKEFQALRKSQPWYDKIPKEHRIENV